MSASTEGQTVVVLGGGVGGLVAAVELRKQLPKKHRVVLVEREENNVFAPSLLWLMTGTRTASQISRPMAGVSKRGVDVIRGTVEKVEPGQRRVTVNGQAMTADHLVVALGAEFADETIPGLSAAGHNFYTLAGAEHFWEALANFKGGRIVVLTAAPAYKCPAAPYEAAMLIEHSCRKRGLGGETKVDLYAAEPGPMGVAGPDVSAAVRGMVEGKGIGYHPNHQVTSVDVAAKELVFANGAKAAFDLLAYVPPHRAPRVVLDCGMTAESGWVTVNRETMETSFPGVYALGDVTSIPLKMGKPLPKAGVFAHAQAEVVASNIARIVAGKEAGARFDGHGACFVETGDGKAGFGNGNFYGDPTPQVALKAPGRQWHAAKVLFEKNWLHKWF